MNVTEVPAQIAPTGFAVMETEGVTSGFTIIVSALLVAVDAVRQEALLVSTQVTILPFANVALE